MYRPIVNIIFTNSLMKPLHHNFLVITLEDGTNPFIFFSIKDPKQDYENFHETITSKMLWKKTNSTDCLAEYYVEMQKKLLFIVKI